MNTLDRDKMILALKKLDAEMMAVKADEWLGEESYDDSYDSIMIGGENDELFASYIFGDNDCYSYGIALWFIDWINARGWHVEQYDYGVHLLVPQKYMNNLIDKANNQKTNIYKFRSLNELNECPF
jgi:hypothetical protein